MEGSTQGMHSATEQHGPPRQPVRRLAGARSLPFVLLLSGLLGSIGFSTDTLAQRPDEQRVGFSNNAKGRFGPAKWEDARVEVGAEGLEIDIDLVNARD